MNEEQLTAEIIKQLKPIKRIIAKNKLPGFCEADKQLFVEAISVIELLLEKGQPAAAAKILDVINRVY